MERNGSRFAVSWTTCRTGPVDSGGHFFLAKYGVRIRGAANTVVVWCPGEFHGTSLQERAPGDDSCNFEQSGMAMIAIARLTQVWKEYQAKKLTAEQAGEKLAQEDSGDEE